MISTYRLHGYDAQVSNYSRHPICVLIRGSKGVVRSMARDKRQEKRNRETIVAGPSQKQQRENSMYFAVGIKVVR